jgi:hypothetical protein
VTGLVPLALVLLGLEAGPRAPASPPDAGAMCQAGSLPSPEALKRAMALEEGELADKISSGPRTGQAALRSRLPIMPGAATPLSDISDGMTTYGVPMNLAEFETDAPSSEVLQFYAHYFEERGWDMTGPKQNRKNVPYPAVSATDGPEGLQLSVMVMGREPKGCTVILGLADMNAVKKKGANAWKETQLGDLPLYPGSDPMSLRSVDQERIGFTVSFETPDPVSVIAAFYRKELTARGYREEPDPMPGDDRAVHLQFLRVGHAWTMALSSMKGRTVVTAMGMESAE